ncbi:Hydrazine synthase subunit beta [Methylophilaceae bacterium]|nr:Hydrazine synthase subunit beta [Methylophilaceae bacterium]
MKSTYLATRIRTSFLLIAFAGALTACGDKTGEQSAESAVDQASTETATNDRGIAYVSNQDGNVTIIDLNTMETTGSIDPKGNGVRGIGITPDGKLLVTANKDEGNISILDTATGQLIQHVEIGKNPEFVRVVGDTAYVSFEPSSKGGPPPKPGEAVHEEDDDDDEIEEPARIAIVDLKQGKKLREIIGGPETEGIEFSHDGTKLIITNEADNTVTIHNIETGELVKTIDTKDIGIRPRGIKAAPDGSAYVSTLEFGNNFLVLDSEFNVVRTVPTGEAPYGIAYNRAGDLIYVASGKAKTLEVFNAKTYEKVKEVATGDRCWHFTFTPDDKEILLACGRSHEVLVIDTDKLEVTKRIGDKELPWGVIAYPKSVGSLDAPQ